MFYKVMCCNEVLHKSVITPLVSCNSALVKVHASTFSFSSTVSQYFYCLVGMLLAGDKAVDHELCYYLY